MSMLTPDANTHRADNTTAQTPALVLSASSITGDEVRNPKHDKLGSIEDLMLDTQSGQIRYVVLSSGGFLGMGDRLFAVPWRALRLDTVNKCFVLDVDLERLKAAPGFDKDHWPNMADATWGSSIDTYYESRTGTPRH